MLNGFGWPHLLIIAALLVVLFGAKRLPDAARGIGRSMRIFKGEVRGMQDENETSSGSGAPTANTTPPPAQIPPAVATTTTPAAEQQAKNQQRG